MTHAYTRRRVLGGVALLAAGAGAVALTGGLPLWSFAPGDPDGARLPAPEAHALALAGDIVLIDIRRPDEWAATGSGEGAQRLDMRDSDFTARLLHLTGGSTDTPVALICARGVRSARLSARLRRAGFTQIIDVPEGMLGSAAGPGWIARGLPVERTG